MRPRLFAAFAITASLAVAADMPSGESLLQHYIDVTGGAQAWAKVKNVTRSGVVEMPAQNISGSVSVFESGENNYTVMEFPGIGKIEQGFNGEIAWENSALTGPRILEGPEKIEAKQAATLWRITAWREVYKEARTLGSEDVDGKPAWRVEMTPKEGKPETFFFDRDSGLLVRTSAVHSTALGDIAADSIMSDFRPADGILTPFVLTEKAMSQTIVMRLSSISYSAVVPRDRFDLPAAIKELASRKK